MESATNPHPWVTIYCHCGHHATVRLPDGPWQHRDKLLPRARCKVCGRRGAKDIRVALDPDKEPMRDAHLPPRWGGA